MKNVLKQLILFSRPHVKLGSAVLASALVHYGLIQVNYSSTQNISPQKQLSQFSVHLVASKPKLSATENNIAPQKISTQDNSNTLSESMHSKTLASLEANSPRYFSPKEVEIQALPVVNVDLSMLTIQKNVTELQQSLPIQLRLYIDEFGQVAKIERIAIVLPQDAEMATQLEGLLKEMQFTPAKRAFTDVKSYQDVAFDFKN